MILSFTVNIWHLGVKCLSFIETTLIGYYNLLVDPEWLERVDEMKVVNNGDKPALTSEGIGNIICLNVGCK